MILEAKRAVSDWLSVATYGLAAVLATFSYDGSDVAPAGPWQIADDTRGTVASDNAAIHRLPEDVDFAVHVTAEDLLSADGQAATYTHDADVPVILTVIVRNASPSAALRDLDYTLRALLKVLETLFDPNIPAALAAVSRNNVQLQHIQSITSVRAQEELKSNVATAQLRVAIRCRDLIA